MDSNDIMEQYRDCVREANREPIDDEYAEIAERDAIAKTYGLDSYPEIYFKRRPRPSHQAGGGGGVFSIPGGEQQCRE